MIVSRFTQDRCLILTDTDVESLLATAMASEQQAISGHEPSMLVPAWWGRYDEDIDLLISAIDPAIIDQAGAFSLAADPSRAFYPPEDEPYSDANAGLMQTRLLTEAAYLALSLGIKRVVWPMRIAEQHPDRINAIGTAIDRAMLVARTASLDASPNTAYEVTIETPFIDLDDRQLHELARDMALPISTCWWSKAKTLPAAQARHDRWYDQSTRSSLQIEPKPGTQAPA